VPNRAISYISIYSSCVTIYNFELRVIFFTLIQQPPLFLLIVNRDGNLIRGFGYPLDIRPDGSGYGYIFLTCGLDPYPIRDEVGMDLDIKSHPQVIRWISEINH
jgi:hypothetical protein